jgi:hypothetical protein
MHFGQRLFKGKGTVNAVHGLFCFVILLTGSDFAAMDGGLARRLSLTGSCVIPFVPLAGVVIYVLIVRITGKTPKLSYRIGGIVAAYLLGSICVSYPNWLFEKYSQKIGIKSFLKHDEMFLPNDEITNFEQTFKTPAVQYSSSDGFWLVVPRNKFSEPMISFLRENAEKNGKLEKVIKP